MMFNFNDKNKYPLLSQYPNVILIMQGIQSSLVGIFTLVVYGQIINGDNYFIMRATFEKFYFGCNATEVAGVILFIMLILLSIVFICITSNNKFLNTTLMELLKKIIIGLILSYLVPIIFLNILSFCGITEISFASTHFIKFSFLLLIGKPPFFLYGVRFD